MTRKCIQPVFVITLTPESASVQKLLNDLKQFRVPVFVFPGVDGRDCNPELEAGEVLDYKRMHWRHLSELTSSEIGCYLAHYRAIKKAYNDGYARICVLEDDVSLEDDFGVVLGKIFQLPQEMEMIRLMALKIRKRKVVQALTGTRHVLVRPERGWCGAQGYVLNRSGMEKIISKANRLYEPIDKFFDHFWEHQLEMYGVEPHIIWEKKSTSHILKSAGSKTHTSLWVKIFFPLGKGWRSLKRHFYLRSHYQKFYPTEFPTDKTGKTARMK